MIVDPETRECATQAMYEARFRDVYVTPWAALGPLRKHRWYLAFDAAMGVVDAAQGRSQATARVIRVDAEGRRMATTG